MCNMRPMPNHPNRSKKGGPARNPKPEEIRKAREAANLTQTQAGELVYVTLRGWQQWEAGERSMHPAFWELFRIKLEPPK
jgi:putative transcriptional regulator